ncbi:N-acetylneuraminate synthase family protein [Desulfosarcina variabilis]|uniref:N-acetylneuraminate synthase family protein n=1 Tax=Desulfosarcina variabilis TaxID=2300 RepID=UPI003AFADDEB
MAHSFFDFVRSNAPYIIVDIGVNHEGSINIAKRLIKEAYLAGANAVKFQSYKAEKLASVYSPAYWDTKKEKSKSQFELFKKYDNFGENEYNHLASYCNKMGINFLSTPFDLDAVDYLSHLVPAFKIASADITNVPLLRKVALTGKPLIISTGASTIDEISIAKNIIYDCGNQNIALLHCILNYPTDYSNAQLCQIKVLQNAFPDCLIGYSDHIIPDYSLSSLEVAFFLGACIIEKHFTFDKSLPGNDHYHAIDMHDLLRFKKKIFKYKTLLGNGKKNLRLEEPARMNARRSIYASRIIKEGEILSDTNLIAKRPGYGISPLFWDQIIGKKAVKFIDVDKPLKWDDIVDS